MGTYLTDGSRLYEVVAEEFQRNYGLGPSLIRYIAVEDCLSGERELVIGPCIARFKEVSHNN